MANSDPVIIPYTVVNILLPYMVQSQGHCPPRFRELGISCYLDNKFEYRLAGLFTHIW